MVNFTIIQGKITTEAIQKVEELIDVESGASATFKGSVRADEIKARSVQAIDFTIHEEIAMETTLNILNEAKERFNLNQAHIIHSIGNVKTGETCFYVNVKSGHRKEAFEALPWMVNEFKEKVPVFGKEILEDGSYVWKANRK